MRYRSLDRQWYELKRARELATGTDEYLVYDALMEDVAAERDALVASPGWASGPAQVIGAQPPSRRF